MKELYTTGEVARICKMAIRTVQLYCEKGVFEVRKSPVTGHRRISRDSFILFMKEHKIPISRLDDLERKTVFIADDDKRFVKILSTAIRSALPDCEIATAHDGYTALIEISALKPDIVIMDIRMPKIDGIELCRRLKENTRTKRIKIVAVTAYAEQGYDDQVEAAGALRCFFKPLKLTDFAEYLKKVI